MTFVAVGAFYAVLALDHMALGPFLLSRPLVVGPLIGWFLGHPLLGLLCGASVELMWIHITLAGIGPLDLAMVTALGVMWSVPGEGVGRASLVAALLLAVPCGALMSMVDVWSRRQNNRFIGMVEKRLQAGQSWVLMAAVGMSLLFRFLKGWIVFVLLAGLGQIALKDFFSWCPPTLVETLDFAGRLLPLVGFGAALNFFYDRARNSMPPELGGFGGR
jgi:mannose/fructose/N-acetylgalactosamine-specific phosphotransferase system component IIC